MTDAMKLADREVADWLLATLRLYGADEMNSHRIVAIFLESLYADTV